MIVFPNCKINLGLSVKSRRPDGYHELETIFYPAGWSDVLEIVRSSDDQTKMICSGIPVDPQENICLKAYHLLKERFDIPPVDIHLHKTIPMGAGLGGGSADGAYTLKVLNEKFQLGLTTEELLSYALTLGSDCPFFIHNRPVIAKGRGEEMKMIDVSLHQFHLLIVYPGIHVSTADAFSGIDLNTGAPSLKEIIERPTDEWKDLLRNDFEKTIFLKHPAIKNLKEWFYHHGAVYASMSGSGSAVFGFFAEDPSTHDLPTQYLSHKLPGK